MNPLLAFFLVVAPLIVFHELGHFGAARRVGIGVDEFSIGFGPRLFALRRGGTVYALRLLPLGGFVRLRGMEPGAPAGPGSFAGAPLAGRMVTIAAGPVANLVLAALLFAAVPAALGVPSLPSGPQAVGQLVPGYPAQQAGLRPGDVIVAIDGRAIASWNDLVHAVARGGPLHLLVRRGKELLHIAVVPRAVGGRRLIGIYPRFVLRRAPLGQAAALGVVQTGQIIGGWFAAVAQALAHGQAPRMTGPVGIAELVGQAARFGLADLLELTGVVSANLGLINLLPIPALDGSRLLFLLLEAVRRRPIDPEREGLIHLIGFAALIALMVLLTFRDLARLGAG